MPFADVDGKRIHYRDGGGSGPALLLFHAFPFDGRMWEGQLASLRDRYRVIAPDLSGSGQSTVPEDPAAYSVDAWAAEGRAVLEACGVERAIVGGCSMGGYVTFAFLRRYPGRVQGLLLVDTRADADSEEARKGREGSQAEVRAHGTGALVERMRSRLLSATSAANATLVERVKALMDQPAAGILGTLEALKNRPDATPQLPDIRVPTVIVVGEADIVTPPALSEAMHRAIPGSRLVVLPRAGHLANLEAPEAFDRALDFPGAGR
jgi:pimeloyl-ACP methyl ester carboxylesterase